MFDLSKVEISNDYAPLSDGYYDAFVDKIEMKDSKAGVKYVNLMWKIFGEDGNNRVVFDMLHIYNANETAKRIALESVKKILLASGFTEEKLNFVNEAALLEALSSARVQLKLATQAQEGYDPKNVVKNYLVLDENCKTEVPSDVPF